MHIGNDVVCLTQATNKSKDQRFLKRVFSSQEQKLICEASLPDLMVWIIWAAKEATFKAYQQQHVDHVFSPIAINVYDVPDVIERAGCFKAKVSLHNKTYQVFVTCRGDYIHAISLDVKTDERKLAIKVEKMEGELSYSAQSKSVRELALKVARRCNINADEIKRYQLPLSKLSPPYLCYGGEKLPYSLSLSHDGAYVAVCLKHA